MQCKSYRSKNIWKSHKTKASVLLNTKNSLGEGPFFPIPGPNEPPFGWQKYRHAAQESCGNQEAKCPFEATASDQLVKTDGSVTVEDQVLEKMLSQNTDVIGFNLQTSNNK